MAKKHRVKRQKYVEHLLTLEKNREAYLEKRRAPKRSREMRNNEEATGEGRERMEAKAPKKRRTESAGAEQTESDEEGQQAPVAPPPRMASLASEKEVSRSATATTAPATTTGERKPFFAAQSFSDLVKASAKAAEKSEAGAGNTKKSLKRRHY